MNKKLSVLVISLAVISLVVSVVALADSGKPGPQGEQREQGISEGPLNFSWSWAGSYNDVLLIYANDKEVLRIPMDKFDNLTKPSSIPTVVAMGYVYENYGRQPEGSPRLVSGYNVEEVEWNQERFAYVITLSGIYYSLDYLDCVVTVTPTGPSGSVGTNDAPWAFLGSDGKVYVGLAQGYNPSFGEVEFYRIGSFQFVVYKYPDVG